jgi:hypothetical protein
VTPPERGYTWEKGSVRRASRATEVLMRLFLLSLTIPTALTGCILVPFFLEPNGGNDSTPVWDSFDSSPWGGGGGGGGSNEFRPFAVFIDAEAVYDGREMDGYYLFANDSNSFQEPIVKFLFVEQAYFNNYNAQYACEWEGKITVLDRVDSRDAAWGAFEVQYTLVQTTCEDFNEATWANGDPTEAIESQTWFIGYGPMSQDFREEFRQAITQWGYAWSDYEPYVFSTWMGVANAAGGFNYDEVDWSVAYDLDPDGGLVYDDSGDAAAIALIDEDGDGALDVPTGLYSSQAWQGFLLEDLF